MGEVEVPIEEREADEAPPRCPECATILDSYPASLNGRPEYRCPDHGVIDAPVFGRRLEIVR